MIKQSEIEQQLSKPKIVVILERQAKALERIADALEKINSSSSATEYDYSGWDVPG